MRDSVSAVAGNRVVVCFAVCQAIGGRSIAVVADLNLKRIANPYNLLWRIANPPQREIAEFFPISKKIAEPIGSP